MDQEATSVGGYNPGVWQSYAQSVIDKLNRFDRFKETLRRLSEQEYENLEKNNVKCLDWESDAVHSWRKRRNQREELIEWRVKSKGIILSYESLKFGIWPIINTR